MRRESLVIHDENDNVRPSCLAYVEDKCIGASESLARHSFPHSCFHLM